MFRLDQSSLNRTDLNGLAQALSEGEQIDARELAVEASQLAAIRALLPSGEDGVDRFKAWRFDGTKFLEHSRGERLRWLFGSLAQPGVGRVSVD